MKSAKKSAKKSPRTKVVTRSIAVLAVALTAAAMLFAVVSPPKSGATTGYCHTTTLSITAPASATVGTSVTVSGAEARVPAHPVTATLQVRKSTSTTWVNKASTNLVNGAYSFQWKAPLKAGFYKVRVRIVHLSASHTSAVKTVTVK